MRLKLDTEATFADCLERSRRGNWKLDDVFKPGQRLDFSADLLPPDLTLHKRLDSISDQERRTLNHIMAKSYLNLFYFVEEYIIADVKRMVAEADTEGMEAEALGQFASEEIKHQELFRRILRSFDEGFGSPCPVLDMEKHVAEIILGNSPLAILLTTIHLEIITQEHYLSSIQSSSQIDPAMATVLRSHWIEEAQHATLDYLEIKARAPKETPEVRKQAIVEYGGILDAFNSLLSLQASMDVESLEAAVGKQLKPALNVRIQHAQHQGYINLFLLLGLRHPEFQAVVRDFFPEGDDLVRSILIRFESES